VTLRSVSPADSADEIGVYPVADERAVGVAVARARETFPAWRDAGLEARAAVLRRFRDAARERAPELGHLIAREVGKALWDARAEAALLAPKVDVTLGDGMRLVADLEAAPGQRATYGPRGVLAVYGPFNFPAHLPNGHIVPALATGNSVVFKPSDLAPGVGDWLVRLWREAGLPDGVLEIVQGGAETGRAKILALELGGCNAMVVCADADLELAVAEAAFSIAASTGQRCTCARRLFVERPVLEQFSDRLCSVLARLRVGPPLSEGVFMGPLVSQAAYEKLVTNRALASEAGGERALCVEPELPPPYVGAGLVRFASTRQDHPYQRDEIFGPEAALYPVDDIDHAIAAVNDSDYGLVASVMTRDRGKYEHCIGRVRTGLLNWNKATVGASGRLPFGGIARSGNDRPAGVSATIYCTIPQAHLESEAGFDPDALPPGMPRP
jgi:succinylglutamic semialdehyde dehydrogenase